MKKKNILLLSLLLFVALFSFADDYYWVGGKGAWSDINSWRLANGQIPNEIPDATDDVIFNQNSFLLPHDTVFILTGNPTCKNFTWVNIQDSVVISGGSDITTFSIYGSITLHPKIINNYYGKMFLLSDSPGNTISCAGSRFSYDVYLKGSGEWILQDTLLILDSILWKPVIIDTVDPITYNPVLFHENGTLNTNNQTIISRGFFSVTSNQRTLSMPNTHVYIWGKWGLSGQNIDFDASNSYINLRGDMSNFAGDIIYYHDIDIMPTSGAINNTDIRTVIRKVHFLGSGDVIGKFNQGVEGTFTMDTLIFDGYIDPLMGPIPCKVEGPLNDIHYTEVNLVDGHVNSRFGSYHRVVFYGNAGPLNEFYGLENVCDTVQFIGNLLGRFNGDNIVNNLLYYKTDGHLSSWSPFESNINHAIFRGDGQIGGSNIINKLSLNSGHYYEMQTDSLIQPGSGYTGTNVQTINQIEVMGGCLEGLSILASNHKLTQALINYTGSGYNTEYLGVRDINNTGNTFDIVNGIDIDNNDGFNFTESHTPRDLFWVGGAGMWNESEHWSLTPGATGGECPPTLLDNVTFNDQSGFDAAEMAVDVNVKHAWCNDLIWEPVQNLPIMSGPDSNYLHIWGSIKLDFSMQFLYFGEVHFESEDNEDDDWEVVDMKYSVDFDGEAFPYDWFFNKVYFNGNGGKWLVDSSFANFYDTTYLVMGELKLTQDTLRLLNFNAWDTLPKGLYLMDTSLLEVHQYQADAYVWNAFRMGEISFLDAGRSTIRAMGDITPPPGAPPGFCNIRTYGGEVDYFNIEFSTPEVGGMKSMLKSESLCNYHLVDYYVMFGEGVGNGTIDTLTFKEGADGCRYQDEYEIDFVIAESWFDTLMDNHTIDTAIFYNDGALQGYLDIGYLQADSYMSMLYKNKVDTAVLYGNADILGHNTFSQLILSPEKKYFFQHEVENNPYLMDTTIILDDWIVSGYCDGPIRLQSDSIGTQAKILYKAQNPTHPEYTMNYVSLRDIRMLEYEDNQYTAENSIDLGNNTNIDFVESTDSVYYWVGGTGDWGDWAHWSHTSGGLPIDEKCTPREINTVIFDNNSFNNPEDTVFVDVLNAYCMNMYWKHTGDYNPSFLGPDTSVLYIYGSLELKEGMVYDYQGELLFDQLVEAKEDLPDTITSRGNILQNHIRFQGVDDIVYLGDDLEMLINEGDQIYMGVYHEYGTLVLYGNTLTSGGYFSDNKHNRTLNMENSIASVCIKQDTCWHVNGINYQLLAYNSTLINRTNDGVISTRFGESLDYWNVEIERPYGSVSNQSNIVSYNEIYALNEKGTITGNFIADTIYLRGAGCIIEKYSTTNVIYLDSADCQIKDLHDINRCFVNKFGYIRGNNEIEYCQFLASGVFTGENVFDTLILYPGFGDFDEQGNTYFLEAGSTQTVIDSLYMRGNQCASISIKSLTPPNLAFLRKDNGFDGSFDYLDIEAVEAVSENNVVEFYAGINSSPLPPGSDAPPGWIFDNAQGYVPGFGDGTERFCIGDEFEIDATNFNGDPFTQYFWEGSQYPGEITYTVNTPGTYQVLVEFSNHCKVPGTIILEADSPPIANIAEGPFCEGDEISVAVSPQDGNYTYKWFNNDTTPSIIADMTYTGGIRVLVTDMDNNCKNEPNQTILVKPIPYPQVYLGEDETIDFGETITLDAGPGSSYHWIADPEIVTIENPNEQIITVTGFPDQPIMYIAYVELDGCSNEGTKLITMFPQTKLGVPTAFSPNNDNANDVLYVLGSGFQDMVFQIYNRYGEMVFETTDMNIGWDGTYNGIDQEIEVYTYYVKVRYVDGGVAEEKGNITLLR